jgi:hypothetical protein
MNNARIKEILSTVTQENMSGCTMSETLEKFTVTLFSNCECRYCQECGIGTEDESCPECEQETAFTSWCDGGCWEYKVEELKEYLIPAWLKANGDPNYLRLEGRRMGWQSRSGYAIIPANYSSLKESLTFNGEWTLEFCLIGKELTVARYSHDEPMGASFAVLPATEKE